MPHPKPTKDVPSYNREDGTPVSGYEASNPSYWRRKTINYTTRSAKVIKEKDGTTLIRLPQAQFNQILDGVADPRITLKDAGVEDWELPTEGQIMLGNFRNRTKVPIQLPRIER